MYFKKIDFVIIIMFITAFILIVDNFCLSNMMFEIGDLHHETFIVTLVFASITLYVFRKRLIQGKYMTKGWYKHPKCDFC